MRTVRLIFSNNDHWRNTILKMGIMVDGECGLGTAFSSSWLMKNTSFPPARKIM
jgi:hypothetical protein